MTDYEILHDLRDRINELRRKYDELEQKLRALEDELDARDKRETEDSVRPTPLGGV